MIIRRDVYINGNTAVIIEDVNAKVLLTKNFNREQFFNASLAYLDETYISRRLLATVERSGVYKRQGVFKMCDEATYELVEFSHEFMEKTEKGESLLI